MRWELSKDQLSVEGWHSHYEAQNGNKHYELKLGYTDEREKKLVINCFVAGVREAHFYAYIVEGVVIHWHGNPERIREIDMFPRYLPGDTNHIITHAYLAILSGQAIEAVPPTGEFGLV